MTVISTGAISHTPGWHAINWQATTQNVRRLQARIVKATQEGKWGKVKALQHLLTHSQSGKSLAVKRVTENQGKNTPGVDKETWNTPEKKMEAVNNLKRRGYKPLPLRRVYIPKSNGKKRPLGIPTMRDRAMQALYLLALEPIAEVQADPNSYGFRKERSTADAIEQCFVSLSKRSSAGWILEGDIKSCFDRISHDWLIKYVPIDKKILRSWLKAGYMEKSVFHKSEDGTPQGGIISPVLANLALDGLEREIRALYPTKTRKSDRAKVNFVRYADDFIITGSSKEILVDEVMPLIGRFLKGRDLELSEEKTKITRIEDGFDFLGQNVRKYDGKLIIKPSKKNVNAFIAKVRKVIKDNKSATSGKLIYKLNPIIWGWANYHRHICSKETFNSVDAVIFRMLWQWAKRRHPMKNRFWIANRYFTRKGNDQWTFTGEVGKPGKEAKQVWLASADKTPIRRHTKIKGEANPFDPAWETYFETRLGVKMEENLRGRRLLLNLWKSQNGTCPVCSQKITILTGWHNHHIRMRSLGGADTQENRVLLHPNCHQQVHSQKVQVVKPRPSKGVRKA